MTKLSRYALALLLVACGSHTASNPGGVEKEPEPGEHAMVPDQTPPKTVLEQVQRWAPPGTTVSEATFAVSGVELFQIDDGKPVPPDGYKANRIVAVAGGIGAPILEGDDAMRAVIKVVQDPTKLAEIALAVNRRPAMLLQAPRDDAQRKHGVTAPTISGGALEFWVMTGSPGLTLMQGRLDLTTGKLDLTEPAASTDEQLANAIAALKTAGYASALETLKSQCSKPQASKALFDALAHGTREDLRARTAMAVEACGAAAVEPLIAALEKDRSPSVRATAAGVLGRLGDRRAKAALEKASHDSDSSLASVARDALEKLP